MGVAFALELSFNTPVPAPQSLDQFPAHYGELHHLGLWTSGSGPAHTILVLPAAQVLSVDSLHHETDSEAARRLCFNCVIGATSPQGQEFLICETQLSMEVLMSL